MVKYYDKIMRMALYVIKLYENAAQYLNSYMKMCRIAMISNDIIWPNVIKIRITMQGIFIKCNKVVLCCH